MSDKVYVGRRCASVSKPPALDPISKIILWIDSENCFEAGDDSGLEFEITCPYGTQQMAEDLLQKLGGYVYRPMQAGDALLDPAAELGDAVTVDGCYTKLASMELSFDTLMTSDISAPGASELPQEYSFSSAEKILNRKIAKNRSLISKTAEQIRLEVFGEDGYTGSSITMQLDKIRTEVIGELYDENGDPISVASAITQTAKNITSTVSETIGDLGEDKEGNPYTVASKIEQTATDITLEVTGYFEKDEEGNTVSVSSSIKTALEGIELNATSENGSTTLTLTAGGGVEITSTFDNLTEEDLSEGSTTRIYGGLIETDSIVAESLHLSGLLTVYSGEFEWSAIEQGLVEAVGGYIGYDDGFNSSSGIGIRDPGGRAQIVCTETAVRISYGDIDYGISQVVCNEGSVFVQGTSLITFAVGSGDRMYIDYDCIRPAEDYMTCGTEDSPWVDVYAAGTSMSDLLERVKALENAS